MDRTAEPKTYYETFDTPAGQIILDDLIVRFYNISSYTKGDAYETAMREGQRSVIHFIQNMVLRGANPDIDKQAAAQASADDPLEELNE